MRILLGVSGGIAAYKTAELVRLFRRHGEEVQVVLTRAGARFITPATLAALTGRPVLGSLFARAAAIEHIEVAQAADVAVVAPATAHTLARMAQGLADDYLTTLLLATPAPVVAAPAMNVQMWRHPATQANVELLRRRGVVLVPPEAGELACGMVGEGRMAEPEVIAAAVYEAAGASAPRRDLEGETVLITAGPTREALDPVRFLSNRSSGRMGYALAAAAARRGASVRLISGPTALAAPAGVEPIEVTTAAEMAAAALAGFDACTLAICAAAVADYRPAAPQAEKIKKSAARMQLELVRNPDILDELGRRKKRQLLIGFAAETNAAGARELARAKRAAKHADLMVLNDVLQPGIGFDADDNAVTLISAAGERDLPRASKAAIADAILDAALALPRHALTHA
ncbi:MAG TPA: bifunctional phosphopantothenoylcysteine decarboxylase/phosphopantothenate--cysteine ligase CoaBC [Terriglobales bacterium]|nr:bifunctional phosphopantothenoylcysteine decarboxylase/phosphopantothenate--cysteine ligase CoaBC [Terriglobales bacterium]